MHPYASELERHLKQFANPEAAKPMKAYMRNQFEYLGMMNKQLGEALREFYAKKGLPEIADLDPILRGLWNLPQREFQYAAIGLLSRFTMELPAEFIITLEYLITTKSWWDTVDTLAGGSVGIFLKCHPDVRDATIPKWRKSEHLWLRRTCILFQLGYKQETDFELLKDIIQENLGSKEFFINKAIGWALRTYSRTDASATVEFVNNTALSNLSRKEALKWLERKAAEQREKQTIYHITQRQAWAEAQKKGYYEPEGYARDGFIHCSTREQLLSTAQRYYANAQDLVVLCIDPKKTIAPVKYENTTGGIELFPHLYCTLRLDAVLAAPELTRDETGEWQMPEGLV
jgi:3-methyladenine DNA glycosylase AlkD/uncharacterized protein (DUF952 family)